MMRRACGVLLVILAALSIPATAEGEESPEQSAAPKPYTRNVAIVLYSGAELLDFAGPTQTLRTAGWVAAHEAKAGFHVYTVGPDLDPITSLRLLRVTPEFSFEDCPAPDVLVVPGGQAGQLVRNEAYMEWLGAAAEQSELDLFIGTGVIAAAELGLLDGAQVTTHPWTINGVRLAAPEAEVIEDVRVVEAPGMITTSGMSSSIDGALLATARLFGAQVAKETAEYIQHEWSMQDAIDAGCSWLNPEIDAQGQAVQEIGALIEAESWDDAIERCEQHCEAHPGDSEASYLLGIALQGAGRLDEAAATYEKAAQNPRYRMRAMYNLACVYTKLGDADQAIIHLKAAVASGLNDKEWIRTDEDLAPLREDPRFIGLLDSIDDPRERTID